MLGLFSNFLSSDFLQYANSFDKMSIFNESSINCEKIQEKIKYQTTPYIFTKWKLSLYCCCHLFAV